MAYQSRKLKQAFADNSFNHFSTYYDTNAVKIRPTKKQAFLRYFKDETSQMELFKNIVNFLENLKPYNFKRIQI